MSDNELQIKPFDNIIQLENKRKHKYFLNKTFAAKLFIKLCSNVVDQSIICFEILNFDKNNRTKQEIETVLPWMKNLTYLYEYISMKETEESKKEILRNIIWLLYRKIYFKNTIIQNFVDVKRWFCVVLEGYLVKLDLIFYREVLSLEEYLIYLIKMEMMNEKEIINKCKMLNKSIIDINADSVKDFCFKNNNIYDYFSLKDVATKELIQYGIIFPKPTKSKKKKRDFKLTTIDNYLKIYIYKNNPKSSQDKTRAYYNLYLGKYVKNGIVKKGQYLGSFLKEGIKDSSRYISKEKCIVSLLNKDKSFSSNLDESHSQKMTRIFSELKNKFFIFNGVSEEIFNKKYAPYMHYRKVTKGEKIFLQHSIYEGIYLLTQGEIKISVNISLEEMHNLMTYLTYSLNSFNEYVSGFDTEKLSKENITNNFNLNNKEKKDLYTEKEVYELMLINGYNIFGTNETYDHKTELYHFTAECISDSAVLYFFPKLYLNILLGNEKMVYNSFIQLVEFRIREIIWKLKRYINEFERKKKPKKIFINNKLLNNFLQKENGLKNKIIYRNERNITTNNLFSTKNELNNDAYFLTPRKLFYYNSNTNINERLKIKNIKLLLNENEKNKEECYTSRKNNIILRTNNNINKPIINTFQRNKTKEEKIYLSQAKNKNKNYKSNIFPYIIVDSLNKKKFIKAHNDIDYVEPNKKVKGISRIKLKKICLSKINV